MTKRVLLGTRGNDEGAWISKPGKNVETADGHELMWSTDFKCGQIVQSGKVTIAGSPANGNNNRTKDVTFADRNIEPFVIWFDRSSFQADTTARITQSKIIFENRLTISVTIRYAIIDLKQ